MTYDYNTAIGLFQQQTNPWRDNPIGAFQHVQPRQMRRTVTTLYDADWRIMGRSFGLVGVARPPLQPIRLLDDDGQPLHRRYERWQLCAPRKVELPAPILTEYARDMGAATLTHSELTGTRPVGRGIARVAFSYIYWAIIGDNWATLVQRALTAWAQQKLQLWAEEELLRHIPPIEYTLWPPPQQSDPWRVLPIDDGRPPCDGDHVHVRALPADEQ